MKLKIISDYAIKKGKLAALPKQGWNQFPIQNGGLKPF